MKNFLFYKRDNGAGAVGVIDGNTFRTVRSFEPGAFAMNWSHIEPTPNGLLFYNEDTGEAALGNLSQGDFKTTSTFPAGFFSPGWTHIRSTNSYILFYRQSSGEGAIVAGWPNLETTKWFPIDAFRRGWTHIVDSPPDLMLFYKAETGEGAIGERFNNRPQSSGSFGGYPNDFRTLKSLPGGYFSRRWSRIVLLENEELLFYNQVTGTGAVGTLTRDGFTTIRTFPVGGFRTGWTHIVNAGGSILFYNAENGSGALGFSPTVASFPEGAFAAGWTHVVATVDLPPIR